jgi:Ca2+-binding RTX toxin-like protein/pimeloyl-ACP methyl ester carboxylesterase
VTGSATSLSDDGQFVVFSSESPNLVPGDTNGASDVFIVTNPFFDASPSLIPDALLLEYMARITAYQAGHIGDTMTIGDPIFDQSGADTGYVVDNIFDTAQGFVAVALTSDTREPIIAIRGTNSAIDLVLADSDPRGVGFDQFVDAWDNGLRDWMVANAADGIHIVGHSLGGSQGQLLAVYATRESILVASLSTFNSPGIDAAIAADYNPAFGGPVTHRISAGDVVAMAGEEYVPGAVTVYNLETFDPIKPTAFLGHLLGAHTDQWSRASLYDTDSRNLVSDRDDNPVIEGTLTTDALGAESYSHLYSNGFVDTEYFGFLLSIAIIGNVAGALVGLPGLGTTLAQALSTRGGTEGLRGLTGEAIRLLETIGETIVDIADVVGAAFVAAGNWTIEIAQEIAAMPGIAWNAITQWTADTWDAVSDAAVEVWNRITNWTEEQWDRVTDWSSAAWDGAVDWTVETWNAAESWSVEAWQSMGDWTASQWNAVTDWSGDQWNRFAGLSNDVLQATVDVGASFLRKITSLGVTVSNETLNPFIGDPAQRTGSTSDDTETGNEAREVFDLGQGDDIVAPGGGYDRVLLGSGDNLVQGTAQELDGDRIVDFTDQDQLEIRGATFALADILFTSGSAILDIDTDGDGIIDTTVTLEGSFDFSDFVVSVVGGNTVITTVGSANGFSQDGTDGNDSIDGSAGADSMSGIAGDDSLNGLGGDDTLRGGVGADTLTGGGGSDQLFGDQGGDELRAGLGNDVLLGGEGNDRLEGEGGDDTLGGGDGADSIYGGEGTDTAIVDQSQTAVSVFSGGTFVTLTSFGVSDLYQGIEFYQFLDGTLTYAQVLGMINGTDVAENVNGTSAGEVINALGGADWITPGGGNDTIDGGAGRDMLSFFNLPDTPGRTNTDYRLDIDMEAGTAVNHDGSEQISFTNIERLTGTVFADRIRGTAGDDQLRGLGDYDWFVATTGNDTIEGGTGQDMISYVEWQNAAVNTGGPFNPGGAPPVGATVTGVVVDLVNPGNNTNLAAGHVYDSVERITGSGRQDVFYGDGNSNDFRGLGDYDWFVGSSGGRERYFGGDGLDTVTYFQSTSGVTASLRNGALVNGEETGRGTRGDAALDLYFEIENLVGTNFDDDLTGNAERNNLAGLDGDDFLFGFGGIDNLKGGLGNDTIDGGGSSDYALFDGNRADYTLTKTSSTEVTVVGADGADTLINVEYFRFDDVDVTIWELAVV